MSKELLKALDTCKPGDLICVDWCDASTGKTSMNGGIIDMPVRSWGVYLGLMGIRVKQIVLAQNSFRLTNIKYDLDYSAIPVGWAVEIHCIQPAHLPQDIVNNLLRSFVNENGVKVTGGLRSPRMFRHRIQKRLSINGRPH